MYKWGYRDTERGVTSSNSVKHSNMKQVAKIRFAVKKSLCFVHSVALMGWSGRDVVRRDLESLSWFFSLGMFACFAKGRNLLGRSSRGRLLVGVNHW